MSCPYVADLPDGRGKRTGPVLEQSPVVRCCPWGQQGPPLCGMTGDCRHSCSSGGEQLLDLGSDLQAVPQEHHRERRREHQEGAACPQPWAGSAGGTPLPQPWAGSAGGDPPPQPWAPRPTRASLRSRLPLARLCRRSGRRVTPRSTSQRRTATPRPSSSRASGPTARPPGAASCPSRKTW